MGLSFDGEESFKESLNFYNPPSTPAQGSSGSIPLQEINDSDDHDICFDNSPSDDPNPLRRVGSFSNNSIPPEERIEVIQRY